MNIYISNLSSAVVDEDLKNLFAQYGEVRSAEVINDLFTGKPRGFGYVEMDDEAAAQKAIDELNNSEFKSLVISVKQIQLKEQHKGSYKVGNGAVKNYKFRRN